MVAEHEALFTGGEAVIYRALSVEQERGVVLGGGALMSRMKKYR